jgi:cell division protein FtsQ
MSAQVHPALPMPRRPRRRALRWFVVLGIVVVLGVVLALLYLTPLLKVTSVSVQGTRLTNDDRVARLLEPLKGKPLAEVSTERVKKLVSSEPAIQDIRLGLKGAHSVQVTIVEHREVAVLQQGKSLYLVGDNGAKLKRISAAQSRKLPIVKLSAKDPDGKIFDTVVQGLSQLPADVLAKLKTAGAASVDSVKFSLTDGRTVVWGDSSQGGLKAADLQTLLAKGGPKDKVIDVSTPERPVTR